MITVVQTSGGHTTAAAPASITPTWAATAAGSTLVLALGLALSGAPTVTPPAGWQLTGSLVQGTTVAVYLFAFPGAPAGTTGQTFNLTGVNGAAWQLYELAGATPGPTPADPLWGFTGGNGTPGTNLTVGTPNRPRNFGNTFDIAAMAYISSGGAYSDVSNPQGIGAMTVPATQTSTTGATNVSLVALSIQQGPTPPRNTGFGGTIAVAAVSAIVLDAYLAADSLAYAHSPYGGATLGAGPASFGGL